MITVTSHQQNPKGDPKHIQIAMGITATVTSPFTGSQYEKHYTLTVEAQDGQYIQWWLCDTNGIVFHVTWLTATTQHNAPAYRNIDDAALHALDRLSQKLFNRSIEEN